MSLLTFICSHFIHQCVSHLNLSYIQAQAIQEEEKKAAMKYGNMKKKQSDVMRKRMMGVSDDLRNFTLVMITVQ